MLLIRGGCRHYTKLTDHSYYIVEEILHRAAFINPATGRWPLYTAYQNVFFNSYREKSYMVSTCIPGFNAKNLLPLNGLYSISTGARLSYAKSDVVIPSGLFSDPCESLCCYCWIDITDPFDIICVPGSEICDEVCLEHCPMI
jgi:hypothetical protein